MKITECRTNHYENPLGYHFENPVFSWKVTEAEGKKMAAARILIAADEKMADVILDTGYHTDINPLAAPVSLQMEPRTRYYWTVGVRTDAGEECSSAVNWFESAKGKEGWKGKWIGRMSKELDSPVFYKEINIIKKVSRARLYITGLGLYEAMWNGEKIGGELLTPYCNNYNSWVQYQTYDVTDMLSRGGTLSVMLGPGWYKGRFGFSGDRVKGYYGDSYKLLAELRIVYEDGTEQIVGTDDSWKIRTSNIVFSNIYDGEWRDDTRKAEPDSNAIYTEAPKGSLTARLSTPVKVREEFPVKELIHTPAGETVLDLGQNITGIFSLRVKEPEGTVIHIQTGEILQQGTFYRDNLRSAGSEYFYVSNGTEQTIVPHFTFFGYRYVKIEKTVCKDRAEALAVMRRKKEDAAYTPMQDAVKDCFVGLAIYSSLPGTGKLVTGNPLLNRLILNTEWGQKDNFVDVPTDCPQRDERMGWTGDAQVFSATACYIRDCYSFYYKYIYDMETEQNSRAGMVPNVVPAFDVDSTSSVWGDATTIIPWNMYRFYGDAGILEKHYSCMKSWVDYITSVNQTADGKNDGWRRAVHYGDWLALDGEGGTDCVKGGTDDGLIASVYYRLSAQLTAKAAQILEKKEDAEVYEALAEDILQNIRKEYYGPQGSCVTTQTSCLLALRYSLSEDREGICKALKALFEANGNHLQTGFVGTPMLLEELTKAGMNDLAYHLLLNEDYPGWLYEVKLGATTIWERWNSVLADGSISSTGMNSLNHYAYGSVVEWMYSYMAGIRQAEDSVGFRKVIFAPVVDPRVGQVSCEFNSASGLWKSAWKFEDGHNIRLTFSVPFGCEALLQLPLASQDVFADTDNPIFSCVRENICYLTTGEYEVAYRMKSESKTTESS